MCGISGQVNFFGNSDVSVLQEMLKWVHPAFAEAESISTHSYQNVAIGGCCKKVYSSSDGVVHLVFSGKLHANSIEDIISGYQTSGESSFMHLDGEFSFILLDQQKNELYAVRDRLGICPLYWHITSKNAFIATTLKAILSSGTISPTPDLSGIATSLALGYISQDVTSIEGVNRLLPGYYLKLHLSGAYSIVPYWSFSNTFAKHYSQYFDSSFDIYCELERKLKLAIYRHNTTQDAACLSGKQGSYVIYDSLLQKHNKAPTLLTIKPTPQDFIDSLIPMIWAMEMPNAELSAIESWQYVKRCKQDNVACYFDTGFKAEFYDYAKEASDLYQTHYPVRRYTEPTFWSKIGFYLTPRHHLHNLRKLQDATPQIAFMEKRSLLSSTEFSKLAPEISRYFDPALFIHQFYNLKRIPKLDASLYYLTLKSKVTDGISESRLRIAQSQGVEVISPFMDYKLLEFFASISPEVWSSRSLISSFPDFWKQNHPHVEQDVASPINYAELFMSKEVWPWFCGLQKGMLVDTGLIKAAWIRKALSNPKLHLQALYAILVLEIWMRLFIDLPLQASNKDLKLPDILHRG